MGTFSLRKRNVQENDNNKGKTTLLSLKLPQNIFMDVG
jgi:hypothetical protein